MEDVIYVTSEMKEQNSVVLSQALFWHNKAIVRSLNLREASCQVVRILRQPLERPIWSKAELPTTMGVSLEAQPSAIQPQITTTLTDGLTEPHERPSARATQLICSRIPDPWKL